MVYLQQPFTKVLAFNEMLATEIGAHHSFMQFISKCSVIRIDCFYLYILWKALSSEFHFEFSLFKAGRSFIRGLKVEHHFSSSQLCFGS
jgi:hypothetical protein